MPAAFLKSTRRKTFGRRNFFAGFENKHARKNEIENTKFSRPQKIVFTKQELCRNRSKVQKNSLTKERKSFSQKLSYRHFSRRKILSIIRHSNVRRLKKFLIATLAADNDCITPFAPEGGKMKQNWEEYSPFHLARCACMGNKFVTEKFINWKSVIALYQLSVLLSKNGILFEISTHFREKRSTKLQRGSQRISAKEKFSRLPPSGANCFRNPIHL